jgi:hypothetical protein
MLLHMTPAACMSPTHQTPTHAVPMWHCVAPRGHRALALVLSHEVCVGLFEEVKQAYADFMADNEGKGPVPTWCYTVAKAGELDVSELEGKTDELFSNTACRCALA